jgi:hypothetical protein
MAVVGAHVFDKQPYKRRSIVKQTIGWLKECRRIGTRFEKLAVNFLAMMKLAMIQLCLTMVYSGRASGGRPPYLPDKDFYTQPIASLPLY